MGPNPKGQKGVVLTQHHWAEVFLEVSGQGGRTLFSQRPCVRDEGEPCSNHAVIVDFGCGQHKHTGGG